MTFKLSENDLGFLGNDHKKEARIKSFKNKPNNHSR